MDDALAIACLIVRGVCERFPQLKLVASHLGGGICEMIGRMDYAYNLQEEAYFLSPYEQMLIKHPPSHSLKMDIESTCYWAPGARCALNSVGMAHFILGTDAPPLKSLKRAGVHIIKCLKLRPADEAGILAKRTPPAENLMTGVRVLPLTYCGSIPASLIIAPVRTRSRSRNIAKSADESTTGSSPRSVTCRLRNSGSFMTAATSLWSLATISFGVPAGNITAR
jgi:Amidohydrolase